MLSPRYFSTFIFSVNCETSLAGRREYIALPLSALSAAGQKLLSPSVSDIREKLIFKSTRAALAREPVFAFYIAKFNVYATPIFYYLLMRMYMHERYARAAVRGKPTASTDE